MTTQTNPHRPGTKAHARWAERLEKNQAKMAAIKAEAERRQAVVDDAKLAAKLPADFAEFGHTRVQAWKAASAVLRIQLGSKRLEPGYGGPTARQTEKLQAQAALVRRVSTMPLGDLGKVIQAKGKAA